MTALVTGGGGFLGGAIVRKLLARGEAVRSFTRSCYPWLSDLGVEQIHGDLGSLADVEKAVAGREVVYHVAAKAGVWGRHADFYSTNVTGTQNIIAACKSQGVRKLVYTSTPSVVHGGGDLEGANESVPYPTHFLAHYPETKAIAERAVLKANGPDLATVTLRPHLIWGPGDPHLIPRVLAKAKAGKLRRIGWRDVKVDVTYVDNAANAHLLAADKLAVGSPVAGKAYFVSDGEPVVLWEFLNRVITDAGLPPVTRTVPVWYAKAAGRVLEWVYWLFRLSGEPPMTRFIADQLSTSHWYDLSAAKRDFGYEPAVSIIEGLKRLKESLKVDPPPRPIGGSSVWDAIPPSKTKSR
jgi:nucleoside-diphosphate-sugar epimerase